MIIVFPKTDYLVKRMNCLVSTILKYGIRTLVTPKETTELNLQIM